MSLMVDREIAILSISPLPLVWTLPNQILARSFVAAGIVETADFN
jgi:hypothetical protein